MRKFLSCVIPALFILPVIVSLAYFVRHEMLAGGGASEAEQVGKFINMLAVTPNAAPPAGTAFVRTTEGWTISGKYD